MGKGGRAPKAPEEPLTVYLKGKVVDVTKFTRTHPGGSKALRIFKDRDATEQFNMCAQPLSCITAPTGASCARSPAPMERAYPAPLTVIRPCPLSEECARLPQVPLGGGAQEA